MRRYTEENITELNDGEYFVFGSNLAGKHDGGAAKFAASKFGAEYGVGEGVTGQTYALPTLHANFGKMTTQTLRKHVNIFIDYATIHKDKTFILTRVGTGIAGYDENKMIELFKNSPSNVIKSKSWHKQTLWFKLKNKYYEYFKL